MAKTAPLIANRERGERAITCQVDGREKVYIFRLSMLGLATLQELLGTDGKPCSLKHAMTVVASLAHLDHEGQADFSIRDLLKILVAGLQEYHRDEIRDIDDAQDVIERAGGLLGLLHQLSDVGETLTPEEGLMPSRPRKARTRKVRA